MLLSDDEVLALRAVVMGDHFEVAHVDRFLAKAEALADSNPPTLTDDEALGGSSYRVTPAYGTPVTVEAGPGIGERLGAAVVAALRASTTAELYVEAVGERT